MQFNIANQSNLDAARVSFHAAFMQFLGLTTEQPLAKALLEVPSSTTVEEWEWLGDMPGLQAWDGDRVLATLKAFKMRVTNQDWASGIRLHQNQIKDDKLGLFPASIQMLADAAKYHRIQFTEQLLINGFAGTAFPTVSNGLAYDGKFFFDTSRVTGSNRLNGDGALSVANIVAMESQLQKQTTYDGSRKLYLRGTHLFVGPDNVGIATQMLTQDFLPSIAGTASTGNILKGRYQLIECPWFTGSYAGYYAIGDLSKPIKPCMFQLREDISTSALVGQQGGSGDSVPRFQRGELWFGAEARYNVSYFEPRLMVGSAAGAAGTLL